MRRHSSIVSASSSRPTPLRAPYIGPIVLVPGGLFWTFRRAGVPLSRSGSGEVVFKRLHQNSYPGRLVLRRWGGVGMVFQKDVPAARWGGVPKVGVVIQKVVPEWGGVPNVGVVLSQNGVVFQKLGWCCPRIPTLYTTEETADGSRISSSTKNLFNLFLISCFNMEGLTEVNA